MDGADWDAKNADVIELMQANKWAIRAVAGRLLEVGAIDGAELRRLVAAAGRD